MMLRGIAHLVNYGHGIASETKQYYKEKKEASNDASEKRNDSLSTEDDEDDWKLDDAVDELRDREKPPPSYKTSSRDDLLDSSADDLSALSKAHPEAFKVSKIDEKPLPCPIVLPQRSPRHRSRGFVHAYPPILEETKGIDQDTFMAFLEEFDKAIKVSPVWDVINAAAFFGTLGSPILIGFPVTFAIQFAAQTGKEMQRRYRTNVYLDAVNDRLFKPHGMYAMMITWKPEKSDQKIVHVDHNEVATERAARGEESEQKKGRRFMNTEAAISRGELSIPESAPLIYPALDAAAASTDGDQEHPRFPSYRAYISDYLDRRRKAKFAAANPTNPLASLPEKPFASTYADPNHQMYHHGPINMVTGGRVDLWEKTRERRVQRAEAELGRPLTEAEKMNAAHNRGFTTPAGYVRRIIQQNVIYLVICNLPSDEEMRAAEEHAKQESNVPAHSHSA